MLGEPCGTPCLVPGHTPTSTDHVSPDEGIGPFNDFAPVSTGDMPSKGVVPLVYSL
jgi:hypothetical protein